MRNIEKIKSEIGLKREMLKNLDQELEDAEESIYNYLIGKIYSPAASYKILIEEVKYVSDNTVTVGGLSVTGFYIDNFRIEYDGGYSIPKNDIRNNDRFTDMKCFISFIETCFTKAKNRLEDKGIKCNNFK